MEACTFLKTCKTAMNKINTSSSGVNYEFGLLDKVERVPAFILVFLIFLLRLQLCVLILQTLLLIKCWCFKIQFAGLSTSLAVIFWKAKYYSLPPSPRMIIAGQYLSNKIDRQYLVGDYFVGNHCSKIFVARFLHLTEAFYKFWTFQHHLFGGDFCFLIPSNWKAQADQTLFLSYH